MKLATLSILLGLGVSLPQLYGLLNPAGFAATVRKFPRSQAAGYLLMAIATLWFLANLSDESISDFASYKRAMLFGFGALGVLTCIYVSDFLAVRGLAIVLMLLAKFMLDTARWVDSRWRLVIVVWAYLMILAGMWFTISPWRARDLINWATANERRIRVTSGIRLAFGVFILLLGLIVF